MTVTLTSGGLAKMTPIAIDRNVIDRRIETGGKTGTGAKRRSVRRRETYEEIVAVATMGEMDAEKTAANLTERKRRSPDQRLCFSRILTEKRRQG